MKSRLAAYGVMLLLVFLAGELMVLAVIKVAGASCRAIELDPAMRDPKRIDAYLAVRHPILGWVPAGGPDVHVDRTSARVSPAFPEPGHACVSVYGDSFAWGTDVDDAHAWSNVLAQHLHCRVADYGVPGYGVDQTLLRFESNSADEAPWVVLSVFPDNLLRNLTRNVGLVVFPSVDYVGLKPRFSLDAAGGLELHPVPFASKTELIAYADDPIAALAGDWFDPTGRWARNRFFRFPYLRSLGEMLLGEQLRAIVRRKATGLPVLYDYYQPGHPSRSYELFAALLARFAQGARARDKKLLVLMLPERDVIDRYLETGEWSHRALLDLEARYAPVINLGAELIRQLGPRPYSEIEHPGGHYNDEGNRMIAESVFRELERLQAVTATRAE